MKKILVPYTIYGVEDHKTVEKLLEEGSLLALPVVGDQPIDLERSLQCTSPFEVTDAGPEGYRLGSQDMFRRIAVRGMESSYIGSANEFAVRELNKALDIKSKSARHVRVGAIIHAMLNQLTLYEAAEVYEAIRMKDIS